MLGMLPAIAAPAHDNHYSLSLAGDYGYNTTWGHYGGGSFSAHLPLIYNFQMDVNFRALSTEVYTVGMTCQPEIEVPVGEFYFDGSLLSTIYQRNRILDVVMAASVGYRMDYFAMQFGFFSRVSSDMDVQWHSLENYVAEPFNLLYKVRVQVRPYSSCWNLHFGMANFTEFEYERMWQPLFFLGAHYDLPAFGTHHGSDNLRGNVRHWRLFTEVECKPTGMFHLDASFYGANAKLGVLYRF